MKQPVITVLLSFGSLELVVELWLVLELKWRQLVIGG